MMESNNQLQWQDLVVYDGNQKLICFAISQSDDQMGCFQPNKKSKASSSVSVSGDLMKKSRSLSVHVRDACCQVEGCNVDLKGAKDYHRRYRICESHSKSPRVIVKEMESRFCQQCNRFHELSEFDDKKRSCRRRLSDHNARRRRMHVETIQPHPPRPSSSFYDIIKMQQNGLLNGLPFSQPEPLDRRIICFTSSEMHNSISNLQMDSTNILDQYLHVPITSNCMRERDQLEASCLLSTNSWSMNHNQATTIGSLFHGNVGSSTMHPTTSMGFAPEEVGSSSRSLQANRGDLDKDEFNQCMALF